MKKPLTFVLLIGVPIAALEVCAHAGTDTTRFERVMSIESDQSAQPSSTLVVRGTIKTYDPVSKTLQLSTSNGTMQFTIPAAVRVRQRWHSIETAALAKCSGFRAAIRYSEYGAEKTVQSVHVFGKDER
jgi:hypothetical protein